VATLDPYFAEQDELWLAQKAAGVAKALQVSAAEAERMVLAALQEVRAGNSQVAAIAGDAMPASGSSVFAVVADTGATVRVIGKCDLPRAVNITKLSMPVEVHGAGGLITVDYMGDLSGLGG
jgi:hypothetical protein